MGRTVPSFRIVISEQKQEWKDFRNALDKSERKSFDEMWDIPRLYVSACSNSVQLVPLHPIIISILFHHYKELMKYSNEVEEMMESKVNNNNTTINSIITREDNRQETYEEMVEEMEEELSTTSLDGFIFS